MRRMVLVLGGDGDDPRRATGSSAAAAQPNSEKLANIARYPEANDVQGLRDFLYRYPELMEGNTTLANLLRH